jgi:molybdopterin converting factor small subunit
MASESEVDVVLHAQAVDLVGAREVRVPVIPDGTVGDVRRELARRHPALSKLLRSAVLANEREYLKDAALVGEQRRLHLIPPVSGG